MKFRLFALIAILALSLVGWTQDPLSTPAPNSTPAADAKSCCHHDMAGMKDGMSCCHYDAAGDKEAMSCCGKDKCQAKDAKTCCESMNKATAKDTKTAMKQCKKDGCCKDGKCCGAATADKTAMGGCGNQCEHHKAAA